MLDDFWGTEEWDRFYETMRLVFPDRPIVEIDRRRFHLSHGLRSGRPLPGPGRVGRLRRGTTYRNDGATVAHWRGIYDDHGRRHGGHVVQFRYRRFLGMGRRSGVSGKILGAGNSHRRQLRGLLADPLTSDSGFTLQSFSRFAHPLADSCAVPSYREVVLKGSYCAGHRGVLVFSSNWPTCSLPSGRKVSTASIAWSTRSMVSQPVMTTDVGRVSA